MKRRIIFVTKDIGAAKPATSVATLARELGHDVVVFAEGKSIAKWREAGFELAFEGAEFPDRDHVPFPIVELLREHVPDVVVTSTSSPCMIEQEAGLAAMACGVPLAILNDFWRGFTRSKAVPDLVLTLDEYDSELAKSHYGSRSKAVIAGNPSVMPVGVKKSVREAVQDLRDRFGRVYLFVGASPVPTTEELRLLIECLRRTPVSFCLIPRFHPKHAKAEKDGRAYLDIWHEMLAPFGERIVSVEEAGTSDELASICDLTIAAHSLTLVTAIKLGKPAASICTQASLKSLEDQTGLSKVPFVEMGLPMISEPQDLNGIYMVSWLGEKLKPFDASLALQEILELKAA